MLEFTFGLLAIMLFEVIINIVNNRYSKNDFYAMGIALIMAYPLGKLIIGILGG
ncbi:MAG: hypothetical protein ACRCX2_10250 [Paraclostridium sp.]